MTFPPIDWRGYNKPPYFPQWLAKGETLLRANYDDPLLADIDAALREMSGQYDLEGVKGSLLDRIGKILAEPREGNDDELYRMLLKLRIMLNTTGGSINDVIKIIKFFYSSEAVHIAPDYPAGISILHDGEGPDLDFNRIIAALIPAGVSYNTKEIFYFSYEFPFDDRQHITVKKQELELLPAGLRRNGQALRNHALSNVRDGTITRAGGHTRKGYRAAAGTVFDTVQVYARRNGAVRRDSEITRRGTYSIPAIDSITAPVTHTSVQRDIFSSGFALDGFTDRYRALIKHNGLIQRDGSSLDSMHDAPMPVTVRKYRRRSGTISRRGIRRDGTVYRDGAMPHFSGSRRSGDIITNEVML